MRKGNGSSSSSGRTRAWTQMPGGGCSLVVTEVAAILWDILRWHLLFVVLHICYPKNFFITGDSVSTLHRPISHGVNVIQANCVHIFSNCFIHCKFAINAWLCLKTWMTSFYNSGVLTFFIKYRHKIRKKIKEINYTSIHCHIGKHKSNKTEKLWNLLLKITLLICHCSFPCLQIALLYTSICFYVIVRSSICAPSSE